MKSLSDIKGYLCYNEEKQPCPLYRHKHPNDSSLIVGAHLGRPEQLSFSYPQGQVGSSVGEDKFLAPAMPLWAQAATGS